MSANIKYTPIKNNGKDLGVWAPSAFIEAMTKAFGRFPCEVGPSDLATLRGMDAASAGNGNNTAYQRLIEAIGEDTTIKVWAEC